MNSSSTTLLHDIAASSLMSRFPSFPLLLHWLQPPSNSAEFRTKQITANFERHGNDCFISVCFMDRRSWCAIPTRSMLCLFCIMLR